MIRLPQKRTGRSNGHRLPPPHPFKAPPRGRLGLVARVVRAMRVFFLGRPGR